MEGGGGKGWGSTLFTFWLSLSLKQTSVDPNQTSLSATYDRLFAFSRDPIFVNLGINRQSLCGNALRSVLSIVYNWFPSDINFQFHKLQILYLLLKKETVKGAINVTVSIRKPSFHTCPNVGTKPFDYCLLGRIQRRSRAQSNPTPPTISLTQFGTPCSPLIFTHSYSLSYTSFQQIHFYYTECV